MMSSFASGQGNYETAAALATLGRASFARAGLDAPDPALPPYPGSVLPDNVDGSSDEGGEVENGGGIDDGEALASDVEMEVVRGSSHSRRPYKRRKRSRFRKMSPRLEIAAAALELVRTEREEARRHAEAARAAAAEAQRRLEEAEAYLSTFDARIAEAEDVVVDAEIEEPNCKWNAMYKKLLEWKEVHGNCNVPSLKVQPDPEIKHLAQWVSNQRLYYNFPASKGKSLKNKPWTIVALNRVGFSWKVKEDRWENHYDHLLKFRGLNGHCNVPYQPVYEPDPSLVTWLNQQRGYYWGQQRGKETVAITPERIKKLEDAGIDWTPAKNLWVSRLEELKRHQEKHGHCHISEQRNGPDFPLAQWVRKQRMAFDKHRAGAKTAMTPERIELLEGAGLVLDTKEDKWMRKYRLLLKFKEEHGNLLMAGRDKPKLAIRKWAQEQRKQFVAKGEGKESSLTDERERLLREAGFCLELDASCHWLNMLVELKIFYNEKSHFDVPESYKSEPRLPGWVDAQRKEYGRFRDNEKNEKGTQSYNEGKMLLLAEMGFDFRYDD